MLSVFVWCPGGLLQRLAALQACVAIIQRPGIQLLSPSVLCGHQPWCIEELELSTMQAGGQDW